MPITVAPMVVQKIAADKLVQIAVYQVVQKDALLSVPTNVRVAVELAVQQLQE